MKIISSINEIINLHKSNIINLSGIIMDGEDSLNKSLKLRKYLSNINKEGNFIPIATNRLVLNDDELSVAIDNNIDIWSVLI